MRYADVAQSVEHRLGKAEVTGPIPVISSKQKHHRSGVFFTAFAKAQSVEHRQGTSGVTGPIPVISSRIESTKTKDWCFCYSAFAKAQSGSPAKV